MSESRSPLTKDPECSAQRKVPDHQPECVMAAAATTTARLRALRQRFALGAPGIEDEVEALEGALLPALAGGVSRGDLSLAAFAQMQLIKKHRSRHKEPAKAGSECALVLLLSCDREQLLVPRRGPFKKLFPGKLTVSACGHTGSAAEDGCAAVESEFRLKIRPDGLSPVTETSVGLFLRSAEFWAVTQGETDLLLDASLQARGRTSPGAVLLDYSEDKRSLAVFVLRPGEETEAAFADTVWAIEKEAGFPPIHDTTVRQSGSLFVHALTPDEERMLRASAVRRADQLREAGERLASGAVPELFATLFVQGNADEWLFLPWSELTSLFVRDPRRFALDLCAPIFGG